MQKNLKIIVIRSLAYTFAMFLVYFFANSLLNGSFWEGMIISKSAQTAEYCEFNNTRAFFHQSMNTYSNLVYFFFGLIICQLAMEDFKSKIHQNRLQAFPELSFLMGFCFIYLSFGSAFFHASLTWVGQRVDMNGTYSISILLIIIAIYHVFYKISLSNRAKKGLVIIVLLFILSFYKLALLVSSSVLLPIFILLIWFLTAINYFQFRKERSVILAILSIILIVFALKIRELDVQKINCNPLSLYQGHSLWHFMAGLSSFCSYAFFRFSKN
jgi:Ceramidase